MSDMPNICDYVKNNTKTFAECPLNAVDSLVFSWLSYYFFPEEAKEAQGEEGVAIKDFYRADWLDDMCGLLFDPVQSRELLLSCAASPRFRDVRVSNYVQDTNQAASRQFSATTFKIKDEDASFSVDNGVLFNKDGTRLIAYPAGSSTAEYVVGSKVTTIGANAFDSCKNLKKLHIPATVKTITEPAVKNCSGLTIIVENDSPAKTYFQRHTSGYTTLKIGADMPGDVNGNGEVDNADVILLRRYVAKWKNIDIQKDAADVNKDSEIDNADVILLRRYVAGWKNVTLK